MKKHLSGRLPVFVAAAATLTLAACSDSNSTPFGAGNFRAVNSIPDSQPMDISVSDVTSDIQNLAYQSDSGIVDVPDGSYKVQITTSPAGGGQQVNYTVDNVSIDHNNQTTLYVIGKLGDQSNSGLIVEKTITDVASGKAEVQFVDAATASLTGTVYLVQPGQGISNPVYSAQLQSAAGTGNPPSDPTKAYTQPTQIAAGNYEIIVTAAGVPVYDSGPNGVAFSDGASFQLGILDATPAQVTSNTSPIVVVELDNKGGGSTPLLAGVH